MNTKNFFTTSLMLTITLLIALGGFWKPASAKAGTTYRLEEDQSIPLGMQGLHATNIPRGVSQVYLDNIGTSLPDRFNYKVNKEYRTPAMEVRFLDAKGGEVSKISALVYVYFDIRKAERTLWLEGGRQSIAIWFANQETGYWESCPTFFVSRSAMDGVVGRLACLAPGSGYYVLGQEDFGKDLPKPSTTTIAPSQSITSSTARTGKK